MLKFSRIPHMKTLYWVSLAQPWSKYVAKWMWPSRSGQVATR